MPTGEHAFALNTIDGCLERIGDHSALIDELARALRDSPPISASDGNLFYLEVLFMPFNSLYFRRIY
jgi:hypothetical protein